jgi:hypothetical protein
VAPSSIGSLIGAREEESVMNAYEAPGGRRVRRTDTITVRLGAVALPLGIVLATAATAIHPHKEDAMDNPAVFTEYAHNGDWIAVHFAQWLAAMLLFGGLLSVYYAIKPTTDGA